MTLPPGKPMHVVRTVKLPTMMLLVQTRTRATETMILRVAAKALTVKAQAAVILMLAAALTIKVTSGLQRIGAYKSEHVSRG